MLQSSIEMQSNVSRPTLWRRLAEFELSRIAEVAFLDPLALDPLPLGHSPSLEGPLDSTPSDWEKAEERPLSDVEALELSDDDELASVSDDFAVRSCNTRAVGR